MPKSSDKEKTILKACREKKDKLYTDKKRQELSHSSHQKQCSGKVWKEKKCV